MAEQGSPEKHEEQGVGRAERAESTTRVGKFTVTSTRKKTAPPAVRVPSRGEQSDSEVGIEKKVGKFSVVSSRRLKPQTQSVDSGHHYQKQHLQQQGEDTNKLIREVLAIAKSTQLTVEATQQQQLQLMERYRIKAEKREVELKKELDGRPTEMQLKMLSIEVEALGEENTIFRRKLIELGVNPVKLVREGSQ